MPLINCKVSLALTWPENCVLTTQTNYNTYYDTNCNRSSRRYSSKTSNKCSNKCNISNKRHKIVCTSCYFINKRWKWFLEKLKSGFKRTIKRSKYGSEMTNQTKTNYLNYLIDPTFNKVNRLFVLLFENEEHLFQSIMYQKLK